MCVGQASSTSSCCNHQALGSLPVHKSSARLQAKSALKLLSDTGMPKCLLGLTSDPVAFEDVFSGAHGELNLRETCHSPESERLR